MTKAIFCILVLMICTSCSKYDPNDLLDPTSTIVKQIQMKFMKIIDLINKAANDYEKTKEEKYKKKWYKLINEYARQYAYVKGAINK
jgi:hypothetical protein